MPAHTQSGFSLPLVLLLIGALAGAALLAAMAARGNARGATAGTGVAQAAALADAGVALALLELERQRPGRASDRAGPRGPRWQHECRIETATLHVVTQDEGGKVDLNFADARLLTALFVGLGEERPRAQTLADAIIDFRDADDDRQPFGAEHSDYVAAGRPAGPKNDRFTDVAEVRAVLGMTADLAARMSPFVTVHSARDGIDPAVADTALVALLVRGDAQAGFTPVAEGAAPTLTAEDTRQPSNFVQPSLRRYYTIIADAQLPHARFIREAIVDSGTPALARTGSSQLVTRYRFWSWRRREGTALEAGPTSPISVNSLPPC